MKPIKKTRRMRRLISALAAMLAVTMIGSTWAYTWTQEIQTRNEYQLGKYSTRLREVFQPPKDWVPGMNVNKDVVVENKGTVPVFVKVTVGQEWLRRENLYDSEGNAIPPLKGEAFPLQFDENGAKVSAALIQWGGDVVVLASGAGSGSTGLPKVNSAQEALGKWLLINSQPDANGELTFYYVGVLEGGKTTSRLMDSVTMNPLIQATVLQKDTVWDKTAQKWVTTETRNQVHSYENAHYTLSVTMDTVQATAAALEEMFSADSVTEQSVISYLETIGVRPADEDRSYDDSVKTKLLYLDAAAGKLTYTPVRNGTENWFMSHLNMLPGGEYADTLTVENRTQKNYDLFMQVVPLEQAEQLDQLLTYIHMQVYNGNEMIYDGTAMGKIYPNSINDLQEVIKLGNFAAGAGTKLQVKLLLDKDTPMELAGLLTQIDWKFMTTETATPSPGPAPAGPKTGDDTDNTWYILTMAAGGVLLLGCLVYLCRTREKADKRPDNGSVRGRSKRTRGGSM